MALDARDGGPCKGQWVIGHAPPGVDLVGIVRRAALAALAARNARQTAVPVTAIGDEDTEERRHSDLFLGNIVEPALATFGLNIIRADGIDKPGMITRQVIEYLIRSRLVIADLSFHNPNVFYELALRHAVRLPIVQIIRAGDRIPFDIHQMRTVVIDNRDIYSLVPKIETYRSEIASKVRRALEAETQVGTPIIFQTSPFQFRRSRNRLDTCAVEK